VLGGYVDGSNLHDGASVIAVAGCAANTTAWPLWEAKWSELLAFADLPKWHHTDFVNKQKKKKKKVIENWAYGEWLRARGMLCEAFETINPICFGATVRRDDYDNVRDRYPSLPDDPYYFLLDRCLHRLIQGLFEHPKDDGVSIYCDQDKDEALVKSLAEWHTAYLRASIELGHPEVPIRKVTTIYGSNVDYVPLQAADVVAHEIMRFSRENPEKQFTGVGSWIAEKLNNRMPWMIACFTKQWLEMELDGRAFVPGQWPGYHFVRPPE
jgi:hypothetical protein